MHTIPSHANETPPTAVCIYTLRIYTLKRKQTHAVAFPGADD